MPLLLSCRDLSKSYGARPLFEGISLALQDDERLGLIGPNGSGKSTLLKILAGVETADGGERVVTQGARLAYLPQVDEFAPGQNVEEVVVRALDESHLDPFERETEARVLLGKVGFTDMAQRVDALSGGWRKRLAIARELAKQPTLLLMDEPTNHLDLEGILWLEEYLTSSRLAFVVITHDRYFLENVTRRIVELDRKFPQGYFSVPGSYADFLARREDYFTAQSSYQETLGNKVRREIEWLRRKAPARTTKARARIEEAGRMMGELAEMKSRAGGQATAQIDFSATRRKTKELVVAEGIASVRGGRKLFDRLSFVLAPGVRLGLLGANGSGKTSLLRILSGQAEPDTGNVKRANDLQMVLFDQNREQLDRQATLRQALSPTGGEGVVYRGQALHIASWAKRFLFRPDQLDRPVGSLSGGEQARVLIAKLMLKPADVLLLDEPTNDLDIPTLEVLEESLTDFPGAIVLVTHDRFMLDRVSTSLLGLDGRGNATFYADFNQWLDAQSEVPVKEDAVLVQPEPKKMPAPPPGKAKKLTYKEQREWDEMEGKILEAEEKLAEWRRQLEDPAHATDAFKLQECAREVESAQQVVDSLYARWAELEAKIGLRN